MTLKKQEFDVEDKGAYDNMVAWMQMNAPYRHMMTFKAVLASLTAPPVSSSPATGEVVEGWVLVPKEPSEEQIEAMVDAYRTTRRPGVCGMTIDAQFRAEFAPWFAVYRALISAAGDKE